MATPNYDKISVELSQRVGDPVSAAATNGVKWSSAQRDVFINSACRRWLNRWAINLKKRHPHALEALQSYVVEESVALSGGVYSLGSLASNNGALDIISVYNSTDTAVVYPLPSEFRATVQAGVNALLSEQYWFVDGGNLRVVGTGVAGTETVTIKFIKNHPALSANGAAGTVVSGTSFSATGTAVTSFTPGTVLASHVGAKFVGLDNGANAFDRTIVAYVSATAFTINSALVADGAGTNGYIIPIATAEIIIPSTYWGQILDLSTMLALEADPSDTNLARATILQARVDREING